MKKNITKEQLNEFLEVKSKDDYNKIRYHNLYELICPSAVVCESFTIGKMIEILEESCSIFSIMRYDDCNGKQWNVRGTFYRKENRYLETLESELCDALWNAVKKILMK